MSNGGSGGSGGRPIGGPQGDQSWYDKVQQRGGLNITSPLTLQSRQIWLRRWDILVYESDGGSPPILLTSSDFGPNALRATFDIQTATFTDRWYADIEIFNLDSKTTDTLLTKDMKVIVNAGYKNAQYGEIYRGRILQPAWERENATDFRTTLHCMMGYSKEGSNFINKARGQGATQRDIIQHIADNTREQLRIKNLSGINNTVKLPRGQVYFGNPERLFRQVCDANAARFWNEDDGLSFGGFADDGFATDVVNDPALYGNATTPSYSRPIDIAQAIVYSPSTGIVGTPQGTQDGIVFRVLLDNRVRPRVPMQQVAIDNSSIRIAKWNVGEWPSILDRDGVYMVRGVHHSGDTRGQQWYTEIIGTLNWAGMFFGGAQP